MKKKNKLTSVFKEYKVYDELLGTREIKNPYKVNWSLYFWIIGLSTVGIVFSIAGLKNCLPVTADVIKNLSFGCFASTIVALLIEIASVKEQNKKSDKVYNAIYMDLHMALKSFLESWSDIYVAFYTRIEIASPRHIHGQNGIH